MEDEGKTLGPDFRMKCGVCGSKEGFTWDAALGKMYCEGCEREKEQPTKNDHTGWICPLCRKANAPWKSACDCAED